MSASDQQCAMVLRCLTALARLNAPASLAAAMRSFADRGVATEVEAEIATSVLLAGLLDLLLSRDAGTMASVNVALDLSHSRWRVVRVHAEGRA
jgi:hypothetical protein